jgi:hypothetical protein
MSQKQKVIKKIKEFNIWNKIINHKEILVSITSLLISVVTIFIMITTNNIMQTTNQIMENQTEISKADKLPILNFEITYLEDESGFARNEQMFIYNEGGIIKEFEYEEITYIDILVSDYSKEEPNININIPIDDYYDASFKTGALQKKLVTFTNYGIKEGNNRKQFDLIKKFMSLVENYEEKRNKETGRAFTIGPIEFNTYIFFKYKDIYGENHVEYYRVDVFGAEKIDNSYGKKIFNYDHFKYKRFNEIDELILLDIVKENLDE